jgi:hypothetical protein
MDVVDTVTTIKQGGYHLCGSRLFHQFSPNTVPVTAQTDWDFCGEFSPDAIVFLTDLGFKITTSIDHEYTDNSTRLVLSNHTAEGSVQVSLRTNVDEHMSMLHSVTSEYFRDFLWKSGPNHPSPDQIKASINQLLATHKAGQKYAWSKIAQYAVRKS